MGSSSPRRNFRYGQRLIAAEEAATIGRISRRVIYRRIDSGALHFIETLDGEVPTHGNQKHKNGPFQSAILKQSPRDRRIHNGNTF
jgi:hypothetical protein